LELVAASGDPLAISADGWDGFESDCLSQLFVGDASPLMFDGQPIDGIPIHHRVAGYPIRSNTGKTIGAFLYIGEDPGRPPNNNLLATIVTALTYVFRAEIIANTLRESEKRHRQLFESLVDVYFRTDAAGTITMVSPSVESLMGFQPEAILGTQAVDHWADPQRLELFSRDLRDKGTLVNREERLRKKDGSSFWASCNATLLKDAGVEAMVRDVTEKKRSEAMLRKALEEKETLLREIHHRVKNNLAVVASMLNLQIKHNKNKVVQDSLEESRTRVHSMALIHETLYQTEDLSAVQLKDYVRKLMRDLLSVYDHGSVQITIDYDIGDLQLDLNQAVYCGLIINELATNAMKYAFVDKATGTIHISAKWNADNEINLSVKDDGVGLPASFDWHNTSTLGLRLISLMVEQLRGSLSFNSHNGLDAVIRWKSSLPAERPGTVS
jgi:PAS domain S-box-containing protein